MKLTYDGHGLNNAEDRYRPRIMTWAERNEANGGGYVLSEDECNKLGPILAAAPDLLAALEAIAAIQRADAKDWAALVYKAKDIASAAIAKAKGE